MKGQQAVILVYSTSHAIRIEKLLYEFDVSCKLIPVPRYLSSDCGVSVRFFREDLNQVISVISEAGIEIEGIFEI